MTDQELIEQEQIARPDLVALIRAIFREEHSRRDDIQMIFRCLMQFARHLAKKYGFTIKQWPEK
jgi:hypothetical protein